MTFHTNVARLEFESAWKDLICDACRINLADLALDGRPLCIDCADNGLEWEAVAMYEHDSSKWLPYPYEH